MSAPTSTITLCHEVSNFIGALYTHEDREELDEVQREEAFERLIHYRVGLENIDLGIQGSETEQTLASTLEDLEVALDELDLWEYIESPELTDNLGADEMGEASQPVANQVLNTITESIDSIVTPREALRGMQTLMFEDENNLDEDDISEVSQLALDYLIHDWRWEEGGGILERVMDEEIFPGSEERFAVQGLRNSWWDIYQIDDFDGDRGVLHLTRMADGIVLDVNVDEDLDDEIEEGDFIIARIYQWSDGNEMGSWLLVEAELVEQLEEIIESLIDADESGTSPENRIETLKVHGIELIREVFFPEDTEED